MMRWDEFKIEFKKSQVEDLPNLTLGGPENWKISKNAQKSCYKFSFNSSHLIITLAPEHWDHAKLVVWKVLSSNPIIKMSIIHSLASRGASKIGKSPKTAKILVINSVFNSSNLILNIAPGYWDHTRLVVWNAQSPIKKNLGEDPPTFAARGV